MLNITYAPSEAELAEKLQNDLGQAAFELENNFLIVLVAPESSSEETVEKAIKDALAEGHKVVPFMVRDAAVPQPIRNMPVFNMKNNYKINKVVDYLKKVDQGERIKSNNQAFLFLGIIVLIVFTLSMIGLASGLVAFPRDEYDAAIATENAARDALIQPTLDVWQPRSTEDAENFPATVEAVGTRYRSFVIMTATAIAPSNFEDEASSADE